MEQSFNNIPVFVVNLPDRKDRLINISAQLQRHGIKYSVWGAVKHDNGRLGLVLTMKNLFEHLLAEGYSQVLILEDDAKILRSDFVEIFNKCVEQLPEDYDLFYPGCNLHGRFTRYSDNLLAAQGMYATHAVIYSRKAIWNILELLKYNEGVTYDILLVNTVQNEGKSYCSFPLLISQETGFSDILGKEVDYEKFIEKRFAEKTKHLNK